MGETANKRSGLKTHEKLQGLPFKNATELKQARDKIVLQAWEKVEHAKAMKQITDRDENLFWREEFKVGLVCRFGADENSLVKVYSEGVGIQIDISEKLKTDEASEPMLGVLLKSMTEAFASSYYQSKGMIPPPDAALKNIIEKSMKGKK